MKILKSFIFFSVTVCVIFISSCDDSGTNPVFVPKGQITFTHSNLKPLDQNLDGLYNLWLGVDSSGTLVWYSLGEFNIGSAGQIIDPQGNTMVFTFPGDTNVLDNSRLATVTVGNSGPLGTVLISNNLSVNSDSVYGSLWMAHSEAFGNVGARILGEGYTISSVLFHIGSPTTNNTQCLKGIWFCDTLGNTTISDGLTLAPGNGWVYEGWLNDETTNSFYSIGRFYDPYNADLDGAGPCAGTSGPPYNKPGQDWITSGSNCPDINIIPGGSYGVFITVEPENESGTALLSPFYLKLFYQNNAGLGCKRIDNCYNQVVFGIHPRCHIKITN